MQIYKFMGLPASNKGIQLTPSSAVFQMTLVGYVSSQLRITLVGYSAWGS